MSSRATTSAPVVLLNHKDHSKRKKIIGHCSASTHLHSIDFHAESSGATAEVQICAFSFFPLQITSALSRSIGPVNWLRDTTPRYTEHLHPPTSSPTPTTTRSGTRISHLSRPAAPRQELSLTVPMWSSIAARYFSPPFRLLRLQCRPRLGASTTRTLTWISI